MLTIDMGQLPNQKVRLSLTGGLNITLQLNMTDNGYFATISNGDDVLVACAPVLPNYPIIPYQYQETAGQIIFDSLDGTVCDYNKIGLTQFFTYMSPQEVTDARS